MTSGPAEWGAAEAAALLRPPGPHSHKYSRGVLALRTGSAAYPGAAVLGAEAAWGTGIGSLRYVASLGDAAPEFGLPTPAAAVLAARPETVFSHDSDEDRARCDAWLIGSGTDARTRSSAERTALLELFSAPAPIVADAGALDLVEQRDRVAPLIITPHLGEFRTLWEASGLAPVPPSQAGSRAREAMILAEHLGATVLLKGSRTLTAAPSGEVLASGPATPWLATAGTGDVLAGILGALVATHRDDVRDSPLALAKLGATAAVLHDRAARIASGDEHATGAGGPITALDVALAIPAAFESLR